MRLLKECSGLLLRWCAERNDEAKRNKYVECGVLGIEERNRKQVNEQKRCERENETEGLRCVRCKKDAHQEHETYTRSYLAFAEHFVTWCSILRPSIQGSQT